MNLYGATVAWECTRSDLALMYSCGTSGTRVPMGYVKRATMFVGVEGTANGLHTLSNGITS